MATCPPACPLKDKGCYADGGPLAIHWRKVSEGERGVEWQEFLSLISSLPEGQVWRHNQAGDLVPHCTHNCNQISEAHLLGLAMANIGRRGFTYTHYPVEGEDEISLTNRGAIIQAIELGFVINLSANDPSHADRLHALGIAPVTTQLPSSITSSTTRTPEGRKIVVCPAAIRDGISCETCKLCAKSYRQSIVGFPAHGSRLKLVDKYLSQAGDNG